MWTSTCLRIRLVGRCAAVVIAAGCTTALVAAEPATQAGEAFHDSEWAGGPQKIPGRVLCAYYDLGGEGVAYHDIEEKNLGSGTLNPADGSYLNEFRMKEGVDISYTKYHDGIDKNPYNLVEPPDGLLYVGWTAPGEWFNVTVDVAEAGTYQVDLLYTSNRGGTIEMDLNGKPLAGPLAITSTNNPDDPIAWRQWHHWNVMKSLAEVELPKGVSVLTVHVLMEGNMNLAAFDFQLNH
jgi:Carbohydrate binding module (family 6)